MSAAQAALPARKLINLQLGWPSPSLFPATALTQATAAALSTDALVADALIYGPDQGQKSLRENIATFLSEFYAPAAGPILHDRLFVSHGASGALATILSRFTDPAVTRRVWMVEPTYFLACPIFQDFGFDGRLRGVPEDEEGIDVVYLRRALEEVERNWQPVDARTVSTQGIHGAKTKGFRHVIYAVPTFSNPSSKTMSLRRREDLVRLAREFDALVVTDDVYDFLRWPAKEGNGGWHAEHLPPPPPRLVDIDRAMPGTTRWGNTLSNGSFSKILAPGVRVGWVEGTPDAVADLCNYGAIKSGGNQGHFSSVIIDQMLSSGLLLKHIKQVLIPTYERRYHTMVRLVKEHLGPLGITIEVGLPYEEAIETNGDDSTGSSNANHAACKGIASVAGGFFMYLRFPTSLPPVENIAKHALEKHDLRVAHGMMGAVAGDDISRKRAEKAFGQCARLCWAWHTEDEIEEGVKRLAAAIKEV